MKTVITIEIRTEVEVDMNPTDLFDNHGVDNFVYQTTNGIVEQAKASAEQQVKEQHPVIEDVKRYWEAKFEFQKMFELKGTQHVTGSGYSQTRARELYAVMVEIQSRYGYVDRNIQQYAHVAGFESESMVPMSPEERAGARRFVFDFMGSASRLRGGYPTVTYHSLSGLVIVSKDVISVEDLRMFGGGSEEKEPLPEKMTLRRVGCREITPLPGRPCWVIEGSDEEGEWWFSGMQEFKEV